MSNDTKDLKVFGFVLSVAASVISWKFFRRGSLTAYYLALTVSALLFTFALFAPLWLRPLYRTAKYILHFLIGILRSIVLVLVFYLIITPLGLFLRLTGKDFLNIRGTGKDSYWVRKEYNPAKELYLKQY